MALDNLVYDLDAERHQLPTGCVYTRSGAAWVVEGARLRPLAANEPMWGARGLILEDAATNLLGLSQPAGGSEWSNASRYSFPVAASMLAGQSSVAHAANATTDVPVREIADPLSNASIELACVWALIECLDNVYVDIGTRDGAQNWIDRARWAVPYQAAYPLPSGRTDMRALGRLREEIGPNKGRLVEVACVSPTGPDVRKLALAPVGDYQNHLRSVVHHVQCEAGPGPTSPIVTTSGQASRARSTAIASVAGVGSAETTLQIVAVAPIWMGRRQVLWQMDADSDVDGSRVALERTAAGELQLVCGGAVLGLGKLANGESVGVAVKVSAGTMRASRDGAAVVSVTASLPGATKERWGHGYAAGVAFCGELVRVRRWLSAATDQELRDLSADKLSMPGDLSTTIAPALYAADFSMARAPVTLLENSTVPSSGNAALRLCYAGSGPKWVYRKGRSSGGKQELPFHKGRRVENKWSGPSFIGINAGDGTTPTITTGRPDAFGGSSAVRVQGSRNTADYSNYVGMGVPFAEGAIAPVGGRVCVSYFARANGAPQVVVFTKGNNSGSGSAISVGLNWTRICPGVGVQSPDAGGHFVQILAYGSDASLAIDLDVCAIQVEDLTGTDQAAPSEYVDPSIDYGFGCAGVRWFNSTCGNSIASSGVVVEAQGAALPEPMGIQWQAPATNKIATSADGSAAGASTIEAVIGFLPGGVGHKFTDVTGDARWNGNFTGHTKAVHVCVVESVGSVSTSAISLFDNTNGWAGGILGSFDLIAGTASLGAGSSSIAPWIKLLSASGPNGGKVYLIGVAKDDLDASHMIIPIQYFTSSGSLGSPRSTIYHHRELRLGTTIFDIPIPTTGAEVTRVGDDPSAGLAAIAAGSDFTAFVQGVVERAVPAASNPLLFGTNGSFAGSLCIEAGGKIKGRYSSGSFGGGYQTTVDTAFKAILRRRGATLTLFAGGAAVDTQADDAPLAYAAPRFGPWSSDGSSFGALRRIADRLWPMALSDADCIALTT